MRNLDSWRARIVEPAPDGAGRLLILALHSVVSDRRLLDNATLLPQQRLTLGELEQALVSLRARGCRFVSPKDVESGLPGTGLHCLVTFDDGYRNNLDAVRLLRSYDVPALFFIVPANVESGRSFWWDAAYRKGRRSGRSEVEMHRFIASVKRLPPDTLAENLRHAGLCDADFDPVGDLDRPLNRSELEALAQTPGMYVGNHTWSHEILCGCDFNTGVTSLSRAQEYLRRLPGATVNWLAYPNGDWNGGVLRMARFVGLHWGVTLNDAAALCPLSPEPEERLKLGRFLLWGGIDIPDQCARICLEHSLERIAVRAWRRVRAKQKHPSNGPRNPRAALPLAWLRPRTYFVYVDAAKQSGQRRATELIVAGLVQLGHDVVRFGTPALNRNQDSLSGMITLAWALLGIWSQALLLLRVRSGVLHINLGQSEAALLRQGTFLLLRGFRAHRWPAIISLHGSWFMEWPRRSLKARWLGWLARRAYKTTVLGPDQRDRLVTLGVPRESIVVVDNTCELELARHEDIIRKSTGGASVRVLFLSLLVDTKGYPEFLDALRLYSLKTEGPCLEVTLCGDVTSESHSQRFTDRSNATEFIESRIAEVNAMRKVGIKWIKGAEGEQKAALFRQAEIFVLPTKLDAQPLVLLEAMASGCAILTSNVGQIAQTVGHEAAIVLDETSAEAIADGLADLARDPARRLAMGAAGLQQFSQRFTQEIYRNRWEALICEAFIAPKKSKSGRTRIWFSFADPTGFSGQKAATVMLIEGLMAREFKCGCLPQPVRKRDSSWPSLELARYVSSLVLSWMRMLVLLFGSGAWLHVSMGQTRFAFFRDSVPLICGRLRLGRQRVVVTLNGGLFMQWKPDSLDARLFRTLLSQAGTVTVLGRRQREQLILFGVSAATLRIVPNSSNFSVIASESLATKVASARNRPLRLLHLSSLIASKGYPEYLQALELLGQRSGRRIEAVLCGRFVESEFAGRFSNTKEAEAWVSERLAAINTSQRVHVRWVRGAIGTEKMNLYRASDIFVMPTVYPVEAQPLVLLEAMAVGCAIITTDVGEIGTILNPDTAMFLPDTHPATIAASIERLAQLDNERERLASAAHKRFIDEFQLSRHLDVWHAIFSETRKIVGSNPGSDAPN